MNDRERSFKIGIAQVLVKRFELRADEQSLVNYCAARQRRNIKVFDRGCSLFDFFSDQIQNSLIVIGLQASTADYDLLDKWRGCRRLCAKRLQVYGRHSPAENKQTITFKCSLDNLSTGGSGGLIRPR